MAKRKVIRKSNRPFTYNPHYYAWGGDFKAAMGGTGAFDLKNTFSGGNVAGMLKGGLASGIGSAVGNIAGGAIVGGLESGAGSAISNIGGTIGSAASAVNPVLGGIISAGSGIIGGLTNRMFGSKLNEEKIAEVEGSNKAINTVMVDNSSADSVMDQWANQDFGADFSKSDIGKDGWFSNKAKNKYKELKKQQDIARNRALTSYENAADAADTQSDLNAMASFAAFGGPLGIWGGYGSGAIGYELAKENLGIKALNAANKGKLTSLPNSFESSELNTFAKGGKIHIKPENRGKFTKYCGGKVTSECIARGKRSSDPAVRKRATFAANARKWHHAFGGDLLTHGAEWDNGLRIIGNGGTHEENPMEGVPMGMDAEGTPNLVEQGEVIFNDYVFSNRIFADGGLLESFNLPKSYDGYSFAAIAEKLGEESKERPNDLISKRGLLSSMSRLQQAQETVRQQSQVGQEGVQYAHGGRMGTLFDGFGDMPNFLDGVDYGDWQDYGTLLEPINAEDLWNESMAGADDSGEEGDTNKSSKLTWLRYAPVVGAAIGLGQNLFSRPDYTSADTILEAANQAGNYTPVEYTPIGNYLQYRPFDRNFYLNKLNAQAGATRRAIMNTTSPSRNAALLAADYNAQGRLGDLARQAEEYNLAQRQAVETFNRGTNMANAEMGLKAAMANQEAVLKARSSRLSGVAQAMAVRDAVDARRGASMSANLTNFFNSLGDIGREEYSRNMIMSNPALYYSIDNKGNVTYKNGYESLSEAEKKEVRDAANKAKKKKAKGGYLTIKKK
ncbi:hypothetical protein [Fusobacterium sp.]|uniref:hypothetical protein n=1 Tax=Fusobacterium sp. TaxID=68766 RepID=UPI002E785431|nr:hypothetical protein [Fusobacterium sp.]MEE1476296.1 hypothetical protein [Fusobacterium sp.]